MRRKKARLIVLIMIGICTMLLCVCLYTIITFNTTQENTTTYSTSNQIKNEVVNNTENVTNEVNETKSSNSARNAQTVKNKVKDITIVNKVEIIDLREDDLEKDTYKELSLSSKGDWADKEVEIRQVDDAGYSKEVDLQELKTNNDEYKVEISVPKDFPFKVVNISKENNSRVNYSNETGSLTMEISVSYDAAKVHEEYEQEISQQYRETFKRVKINNLAGYQLNVETENDKNYYTSVWYLTDPDEADNIVVMGISIYYTAEELPDFDINEFINSYDFNYALSSVKVYKLDK